MMMADQLKTAMDFLDAKGFPCTKIMDNAFLVDVLIHGEEQRIRCELPKGFPYKFPVIKLLSTFYDEQHPWPHVEKNYKLCIYDDNVACPDINRPNEIVYETIMKAIKIIEDGSKGINHHEFQEEFEQYWLLGTEYYKRAFLLDNINIEPDSTFYFTTFNKILFIGQSKKIIQGYIEHVYNTTISHKKIFDVHYIQLNGSRKPPFPKNIGEALEFSFSNSESNCYENYILKGSSKDRSEKMVLFHINNRLYGWYHGSLQKQNGHRVPTKKNRDALHLYYDDPIIKFGVKEMSKRRIFNRGGDGLLLPSSSVSVTGCGSLGSYIATNLAQSGIDSLSLVDNQNLCMDNIGRHIGGASEVGKPKVELLKNRIVSHYPYVNCTTDDTDIFDIWDKDKHPYRNSDINIVAIGNLATEIYFDDKFREHQLTGTRIYVWTEPFLLGAHALIISDPKRSFQEFFNTDLSFEDRVILDPSIYTKRDLGCQTTYVPYAGLMVQMFCSKLTKVVLEHVLLSPPTNTNMLYTFLGDMSWARKENIDLNEKWLSKRNFSDSLRRI